MDTQWDVGFHGRVGMKYPVLFEFMARLKVDEAEWWQTFEDVRHLESEALSAMRNKP